MKVRNGYVSNSSSSSFIISYDEKVFGDLQMLLKNGYLGCETHFRKLEDVDEECHKELVEERLKEGKKVIYFSLDQEYEIIVDLLKQIGNNIEGSVEFIYDGSDW